LRAWGPGRIVAWSVVVMGLLAILVFAVVPEA
jgi:hypothetical protein